MIFVATNTESRNIDFKYDKDDIFVHLGDWEQGNLPDIYKILISGEKDIFESDQWDVVVDGMLKDKIWFSHEPAERLPKGALWNVCGHIENLNDYGYELKPFHIV